MERATLRAVAHAPEAVVNDSANMSSSTRNGAEHQITVHLVNPSDTSFGTAVITPRWLYILAAATPGIWQRRDL